MLTFIGNRSLSVHASRSTPVPCRASVLSRHLIHINVIQHPLHARPVVLVCKAAAEEATAAEPTADADAGERSSSQGRKQQQQQRRGPRTGGSSSSSSSRSKSGRMQANTLYVQNLPWTTLSEDLQEAFRGCRGFEDAFIMLNKNERPAGYGFVRFASEEAAAAAAEAMDGTEMDGRAMKVRFARPGRTDTAADTGSGDNTAAAPSSSSSSSDNGKSSKYEAPAETETRVVVSNLPAGFTWREVLGMCSLFGEVKKVIMYSKDGGRAGASSAAGITTSDAAAAEQAEQDAPAVGGDAAGDEVETEAGSSSSSNAQQGVKKQGAAAVALMVSRAAAEKAVAELDRREVQGSFVRANFWRRRASKKDQAASAAA